MKKVILFTLLFVVTLSGYSQIADDETQRNDSDTISLSDDINNTLPIDDEDEDAVNVRLGDRKIRILESMEGTEIKIDRYDRSGGRRQNEHYDYDENDKRERRNSRFKGHWSGVEFGFNNYNFINSMDLPGDIAYMSLHSGKSHSFNLNFSQVSLGIFRHLGIVTGMGLNWNNYVFSGNNNIVIDNDGHIAELVPLNNEPLKKSKFTTLFLNVPAILEMQLPTGEGHWLNIGAGVIGGMKLGSHTKMIYDNNQKVKSHSDLNMNIFRGGVTGRIGYQNFMLYGTYYLTPWFKENNGPGFHNLEPFEIGFALTFND